MFKLFLFSFLSLTAIAEHKHDPAGVHGMLLIAGEKNYISHLPLFGGIHNYQLIVEVEIKGNKLDPKQFYTIEPEKFSLTQFIQKPFPFKAKIYDGHFERGGKFKFAATLTPKNTIYSKAFDTSDAKPKEPNYILFGSGKEFYIAHQIVAPSDFDELIEVKLDSAETLPMTVTLVGLQNKPIKDGKDLITAKDVKSGKEIKITPVRNIYLEEDELKN